jgi:DNA polymerase-3 subunit gamma/tau
VPQQAAPGLQKEEMGYLVLARKWRPQDFDSIIGQEPIMRILKNSIEQGKTAHAYLFSGPRGVGKTSSARILAKALNCKAGPTPSPCGLCPSCVSITDGSSVDVLEIDGASNNSVNDIRDLRERVKYSPAGGKFKIYIIDEAHMLSDSAFNALLKTLEEPPPHVVFVLATTAPKKIPSTVLSRCQHLPFRRISSQKIKERLITITESEGITASPSALELIARDADGSLRDSLTIMDQLASFSSEITVEDVKDLLGISDVNLLSRVAQSVIDGKREEILGIIHELADKGTDLKAFTKELVSFFRDLLIAHVVRKPETLLDIGKDEMDAIKTITGRTSEEQLTLILSEIMKAELDVRNASSPRLALEMSLLRISYLNIMTPLKDIIENIDRYSCIQPPDEKPAIPSKKEHQVCSEPEETNFWEQALGRIEAPLASMLSQTRHSFSGNELTLTLNGNNTLFVDSIEKNIRTLEHIFSEEAGKEIRITIEAVKEKVISKKELKQKVMEDPVIQEALELFDGRLVDVIPVTDKEK